MKTVKAATKVQPLESKLIDAGNTMFAMIDRQAAARLRNMDANSPHFDGPTSDDAMLHLLNIAQPINYRRHALYDKVMRLMREIEQFGQP